MRYPHLTLIALIAACGGAGEDVRFELGERKITVDTTEYSFTATTTQPVIAHGRDSAQTYLLVVYYKQGVSLSAGKKPYEGEGMVVLRNGKGEIVMDAYAARCREYRESDCLEKYVDPEHYFEVIGYVPASPP